MKLLIITQKVDSEDPVLGFMHRWIESFAQKFEKITVIGLSIGKYNLPENVHVLSLGKETGESRLKYVQNLVRYSIKERNNYDAVFVHMNQEYVLLMGWYWRLLGKKVTMWRNHHAGSWLTNLAVGFCNKVFCTSKFSYTARFKKTILMPVGVDTDFFVNKNISRNKDILFLARIAPIKKPHVLIGAITILKNKSLSPTVSIYGDPLPKDKNYYNSLLTQVADSQLENNIVFQKGIANSQTVDVYNTHAIFVNLSTSGMYDKTIFEAMACETLALASNDNLIGQVDNRFIFKESNVQDLALKLQALLKLSHEEKVEWGRTLRAYVVEHHSLKKLVEKLERELR